MKLGTNIHHVVGFAEKVSRSKIKGQGHIKVECTFPASTYDRPAVVREAEAY